MATFNVQHDYPDSWAVLKASDSCPNCHSQQVCHVRISLIELSWLWKVPAGRLHPLLKIIPARHRLAIFLHSHRANIKAMLNQVHLRTASPPPPQSCLVRYAASKRSRDSGEDTESTANEKRVLALFSLVVTRCSDDVRGRYNCRRKLRPCQRL